jgi:hypothetical protein
MSGVQDFEIFCDDFGGTVAALPASADPATPWLIDDTSTNGAPTYTKGTSVATLKLAADSEVENVCLHFGDALDFDIDDIQRVEIRCKLDAVLTTGTEVVWGVGSARNDATDSVACNAWFKMIGASSTTAVYVETDDGSTDDDDNATGETLGTSFKRFVIDFTGGKSNVKFYIDGKRVLAGTTFSLAGYSAGLQPIVQIQKAANTNVNGIVIDYIKVTCKRRAA